MNQNLFYFYNKFDQMNQMSKISNQNLLDKVLIFFINTMINQGI